MRAAFVLAAVGATAAAMPPFNPRAALEGVWDGHIAGPGGATPQRVRYNATQTAPGLYVVTVDATADGKKTLAALQVWTVAFDDGSNTSGVLTLAPAPCGDAAAAAADDVDGGVFLPADGASSCAFDFASVGFDAGVSTGAAAHPHGLRCFWALGEEQRKDVSVGTLTLALADAASGAAVGNFAARRRPRKLGSTSWLGRYGQMGGFGVLLLLQIFMKSYLKGPRIPTGRGGAGRAQAAAAAAAAAAGTVTDGAAPAAPVQPSDKKKD